MSKGMGEHIMFSCKTDACDIRLERNYFHCKSYEQEKVCSQVKPAYVLQHSQQVNVSGGFAASNYRGVVRRGERPPQTKQIEL